MSSYIPRRCCQFLAEALINNVASHNFKGTVWYGGLAITACPFCRQRITFDHVEAEAQ